MIKPFEIGQSCSDGLIDRVIIIYWGSGHSAVGTFDNILYECIFRVNGKWYINSQCEGPNGGEYTSCLSNVTDSNAEAFAEECKAKWQPKSVGNIETFSEKSVGISVKPSVKSGKDDARHGKAFKGLLERYFGK